MAGKSRITLPEFDLFDPTSQERILIEGARTFRSVLGEAALARLEAAIDAQWEKHKFGRGAELNAVPQVLRVESEASRQKTETLPFLLPPIAPRRDEMEALARALSPECVPNNDLADGNADERALGAGSTPLPARRANESVELCTTSTAARHNLHLSLTFVPACAIAALVALQFAGLLSSAGSASIQSQIIKSLSWPSEKNNGSLAVEQSIGGLSNQALNGVLPRSMEVSFAAEGMLNGKTISAYVEQCLAATPKPQIKRKSRRQAAIEAENRMDRNQLADQAADATEAVLAAVGYNFHLVIRWLKLEIADALPL